MTFTKSAIALACGLAVSVSASASFIDVEDANNPTTFQVDDGSGEFDKGKNDYVNTSDPLVEHGDTVEQGRKVVSSSEDKFRLTFTYLFKEAGFTNSFWFQDDKVFNTSDNDFGDEQSFIYDEGMGDLDFFFSSESNGDLKGSVHNSNNDSTFAYDFFTFKGDGFILLGLDDGGAGPDDNHDDMIIKVTASKVPEPETLALLGLGLVGLGAARRRSAH